MWNRYLQPTTLAEASAMRAAYGASARLVAGGTDLIVELRRGARPTETIIDLTHVAELRGIARDGDLMRIGALATHNDVVASAACRAALRPLAQACQEVGAPQLRTRATVAGNLMTASPANDTIAPAIALGGSVVLISERGERIVPLSEFYLGVRKTALQPDELVREIRIPAMTANQRGRFIKLGLRRAQAISVINACIVLTFDDDTVAEARITLGSVAPTIIHAASAEAL
ncbi:MAG: FAD binding domain-containing protein, partial [Thermomicrobiales bacterium]|nr:FAD binding domain-containing protein [Thermomicrobiales bacterium]